MQNNGKLSRGFGGFQPFLIKKLQTPRPQAFDDDEKNPPDFGGFCEHTINNQRQTFLAPPSFNATERLKTILAEVVSGSTVKYPMRSN